MSEFPSFLKLNNVPLYAYTIAYLSILSVSRHLLHFWTIMNSATRYTNISLRPCFQFFWVSPEVKLQGQRVVLFLIFLGPIILFSTEAALFYISTNSVQGFQLLSSCWQCIFCLFFIVVILMGVRNRICILSSSAGNCVRLQFELLLRAKLGKVSI